MIGLCCKKEGDDGGALDAYKNSLRLNPFDLETRRLLNALQARLAVRTGEQAADEQRWRDALNGYQKAVNLDPLNAAIGEKLAEAKSHVRYSEGAVAIERIYNGLVVEVAAPQPSATVAFQLPPERAYERGTKSSAPVQVNSKVVDLAVLGHPAAAKAAGPRKAPEAMHRHLDLPEPGPALENPLDLGVMIRDRELLKPLDPARFRQLSEYEAVVLLVDRYNAIERQITAGSADRLEAEIQRLQAEGKVPPGENVLGAMRRDPVVAAEVDQAAARIAEDEKRQIREATRDTVRSLVEYFSNREEFIRNIHDRQALADRFHEKLNVDTAVAFRQAEKELDDFYEQWLRENPFGGEMPAPGAMDRLRAAYNDIQSGLLKAKEAITIRNLREAPNHLRKIAEGQP